METKIQNKYNLVPAPNWAEQFSNQDFFKLCEENEKEKEIKKAGKGLCYLFNQIVNTSNQKNDNYLLRAWNLNTADTLQGASINEFLLRENEYVDIHRILVLRDGEILDKTKDLNVRVFDDEQSSSYGSINKTKKVHCLVNDLRLQDIFVLESTVTTIFDEDDYLDKKFFRLLHPMPSEFWYYKVYSFKFLQNREEDVDILKRFFRNPQDEKIPEMPVTLEKGKSFEFKESNFQFVYNEDYYSPFIEIATDSTWQEISSYVFSLYKDSLSDVSIKNSKQYERLGLSVLNNIEDKIQTIIEYVQDQTIYLYDAEVMDGHLPQAASVTMEMKSGDCKAKSLLLINLLNTLGIKAEFLLVNYNLDYFLHKYMPSPFIFNHAIVKIKHKDKDFYIDPTWIGRVGILEKRAEPFFSTYLPVKPESALKYKEERITDGDINIETTVTVDLSKEEASIIKESLYRRESADIMRNNFKIKGEKENLNYEHDYIYKAALSTKKVQDIDSLFEDAEFKVLSDDPKNNEMKVIYKTKVKDPLDVSDNSKIFRFYYDFNIDQIEKHKHKDRLCDSFCSYPIKYTLIINTKDFVPDAQESIVKRQTEIDNKYFHFENKKKVSGNKVEVYSEFTPYTYGFIKAPDFENIKKDFVKILDSNFGVGIVLLNNWQALSKKWYFFVLIYVLFLIGFIALSALLR